MTAYRKRVIGHDVAVLSINGNNSPESGIPTPNTDILAIFKDAVYIEKRTSVTTEATKDNMTHRRPHKRDWEITLSQCTVANDVFHTLVNANWYMSVLCDWGDGHGPQTFYGIIRDFEKNSSGPGEQVRRIVLESFGYEDSNQ